MLGTVGLEGAELQRGGRDVVVGPFESRLNDEAVHVFQGKAPIEGQHKAVPVAFGLCAGLACRIQLLPLGRKRGALREKHSALDHVSKLPHIAGPCVGAEQIQGVRGQALDMLSVLFVENGKKVINQKGNVRSSLTQRRHPNGHDVQAVV